MSLRATSGPAASTRSAKIGERVEFRAKIENTGSAEETIKLVLEEMKDPLPFELEPSGHAVPPKGRRSLAWTWTATLPEGKTALTYRGKLVLRRADGALAGSAPLDLYVSS